MIRLVISNQRGGATKTTTTAVIAREFADRGKKVLVIDTDGQGSISSILGLTPNNFLSDMLMKNLSYEEAIVKVNENLSVICSSRETNKAESVLMANLGREMTFKTLFATFDKPYDVVLIDVSPSISLLQTCAMIYAQHVLIPVSMDFLSYQGALAAVKSADSLKPIFDMDIRVVGLIPANVNRSLAMTSNILAGIESIGRNSSIPVLPIIRTDQSVTKAARMGKFLVDFDPKSKALADYRAVVDQLMSSDIDRSRESYK